ncbi:NAD+ diphosphatase [Parelusimicrobium proximum]|uniref:NAD(+) diphosphatase n=1 Tax=Parelusimicrobium proximum TaxID=3228953 RepID=UPI003D17FB3E
MKKKFWFIFYGSDILLGKVKGKYTVPLSVNPPVNLLKNTKHRSGVLKGYECRASALAKKPSLPAGFEFTDLRGSYNKIPENMFKAAGKSAQIIYWDANSRFCSFCGNKNNPLAHNAKVCPSCGKETYTQITPAVMVLIRRGREILMVRGVNFRRKFYGLVAGFVEAGETLEECCKREVMEETGIKIKNIRYFMSQPWPFPSNMMIGFFADYAGGKLKIDRTELSDAGFYTLDNMPPLPGRLSLARKMVNAWIKEAEGVEK